MSHASEYAEALAALHVRIASEESESIERSARAVADRIRDGGLVYVVAPGGHSQLAALDAFYRPGGLVAIAPLIDAETTLSSEALLSTRREREPGRGTRLIADAELEPGAVLLIINAFGVNATVVDAALAARDRQVTIIGLSSRACENAVPIGHPARIRNRTLSSLCDVHVDTKVPPGDATLLGADAVLSAPMATSANAFTLHSILIEAMAMLRRDGYIPDVWSSSNMPGGDVRNAELAARYVGRVAAL